MSDGGVPPRQPAEALVGGAANRAAPGSAGEEDEEIYDDESSDYNSSSDDESDESGSYYEDGEEEEEEEGAGGDRASGSADEEAASAGVGGGPKAEGSPRAAATCCICMDPWASCGAHRICCIPCGHVYGRSCLERWLRRGGNTSAKCPQCGERFKHRHIINLYSPAHPWNDCCLKEPHSLSLLAQQIGAYMEYTREENMAWQTRVALHSEHSNRMMAHIVECMRAGTIPMLEPAPTPPLPPVLLTFEEFLAQNNPTPGIGGSSVGGGGGANDAITPQSRTPVTPIHRGGGCDGSGAGSSDDLGFGGLGGDVLGGPGGRPGA